jgi:hypothetical protein
MFGNLAVKGEGHAVRIACRVGGIKLAHLNAGPVIRPLNKGRGGLKRRNGTGSQTPSSTASD